MLALDLKIYNNGGNSMDLSLPVLERAMFHSDNVYEIPNMRIVGRVCFTNFPSHTAFRGFGGPQGMLIAENWIQRISVEVKKSPEVIRVRYETLLYTPSVPKYKITFKFQFVPQYKQFSNFSQFFPR